MTTFQDGPARDQKFMLERSPYFLRVTECRGKWDALDQLDDVPLPAEKLYVYRLVDGPWKVHIRRQGGGGIYSSAIYRLVEEQPTDAWLRITDAWRSWCAAHAPTKA